jgi:transposase
MPRTRPAYPPELRQKIVELARAGRNAASLAREFEPTETTIRNWVAQADRDAGVRSDGLTTDERKELSQLRRENRMLREEREILPLIVSTTMKWFSCIQEPLQTAFGFPGCSHGTFRSPSAHL